MQLDKRIESLPAEYRHIYDELLMPVDTNIKISSVILSDENQRKLAEFLKENEFRDKLVSYGLTPMNRLLFYGASGTGKTFLTKALSNHMGYTMLYVDIAKALSDNTIAHSVSDIFKLGNYLGKCIIFFDECDSIAWNRDAGMADSGMIRRATNSLFQSLDQMDTSNIFIAATNLLHKLDSAFERRFNMRFEFRRPELNIKDAIKKFILPKFVIIDDVDSTTEDIVGRRAKQYAKLSYYELQGLVERAMKTAVISGTNKVYTSKIFDDLAIAMSVKLRFKTALDSEEIFKSPEPY